MLLFLTSDYPIAEFYSKMNKNLHDYLLKKSPKEAHSKLGLHPLMFVTQLKKTPKTCRHIPTLGETFAYLMQKRK